ncbi:MAG: hypothetical protein LCH62_00490, partial [Proteobacteria bacterium]|nr:hypothetical protein [Pseudomonadota bacterium]
MTIESPVPDQKPESAPAAEQSKASFFRSRAGRIALGATAAVLLVGGVAVAQGARERGMGPGGMGPGGMGAMMGPRGIERLCALDVNCVSQRIADGLARRLTLPDAQKPALNDRRQSFVTAA